ncbi:MAG: cysteine methyltransferase, partial [Acidobacteria bacterium]|nr:cysteine methyltransferase [Acidobacteriota bacterium]
MKREEFISTPIGALKIATEKEKIQSLEFVFDNKQKDFLSKSAMTKRVEKQLKEYFTGKRKSFDLNFYLVGTDFQKKVWRLVSKIPYG